MQLAIDTALITGSSGGIGEEFARRLAARKTNLVLVARRLDKLEELRAALLDRNPGIEVDVIEADLSLPGSGVRLAVEVGRSGRRIDALINNAGFAVHGDFVDQEPEPNAAQIQLNCGTLVDLTARFLPPMTTARHGLVINVASTAAFQPTPNIAVYGATKAFVLSFTEALWQETKGTGVRVLTLCPGATKTEFFTRAGAEFMTYGRQTPQQVVDAALKAVDKSSPTVISGAANTALAYFARFAPRQVMSPLAQWLTRAT